ncbi:MAG: hypothetical protein SO072_04955 [Dysosmobacter sp.]|nr:hypothetical protein [Dysosmobacter sp.]
MITFEWNGKWGQLKGLPHTVADGMSHTVTHTGKGADGTHGAESSEDHASLKQKSTDSTGKQLISSEIGCFSLLFAVRPW